MFETLRYEVADRIATITLDRPDKLNAFNTRMMAELVEAFDRSDADDDVGCVLLTGAGRAYCAGADISGGQGAFERLAEDPARAALRHGDLSRDGGGVAALRIFESLKPVVAAINGPAVGIGATMLLPADIRLASTSAKFGFVFTRRGIVPEAASSWFLPRTVGISRALEWTLAGRMVSADEALEAGLVRSLHAPEALMPAARALAHELAHVGAPVAVALTRQMLWRMLGADHPMAAHRTDSRAMRARGGAPDTREGVQAFLEKRDPAFAERVSDGLPDIWVDPANAHFY
ncbi:crotonase/enoyl-CoA hydratase family protein [Sphingomonas sp. HITSZ_GF]|uniref:crotonase/enoyl-CoA hydratase family protein n=1 Tax=Sphingomonas sp. HITSZ_GF TaxID=3037247 RepID=UPI00240D0D63|nr:crotonase/enoyl-CoA hydratase family protein [Sphingomonas sp. HITSZ_GF]MDG2533885.1 crotonase/enoyl-CoA hydratase family protein [Sphingomonas sp. HITSZ_GF]